MNKPLRFYSFARLGENFHKVEVEVRLLPGLPMIHFIGLPDTALRESRLRIKSALRSQGFQLPKGRQVIVNLRPNHIKKTSQGLDLAIATAILFESGLLKLEVDAQWNSKDLFLYGELSLNGDVQTPEDLKSLPQHLITHFVISGETPLSFPYAPLRQLRDLCSPLGVIFPAKKKKEKSHLSLSSLSFSKTHARWLIASSVGEHSSLLAGPAGTGKTTLVEALAELLQSLAIGATKRPFIRPHHSITMKSMIGGGRSLWSGEITSAHGGLLLLDELLEFQPSVLEALREPIETKSLTLAVQGQRQVKPADFILQATTNLCPCGQWVPRTHSNNSRPCQFSRRRCYSSLEKLSEPFLDRFNMLVLIDHSGTKDDVSLKTIARQALRAKAYRLQRVKLHPHSIQPPPNVSIQKTSRRRKNSWFELARTFADMDASLEIKKSHWKEARIWTQQNFLLLAQSRR